MIAYTLNAQSFTKYTDALAAEKNTSISQYSLTLSSMSGVDFNPAIAGVEFKKLRELILDGNIGKAEMLNQLSFLPNIKILKIKNTNQRYDDPNFVPFHSNAKLDLIEIENLNSPIPEKFILANFRVAVDTLRILKCPFIREIDLQSASTTPINLKAILVDQLAVFGGDFLNISDQYASINLLSVTNSKVRQFPNFGAQTPTNLTSLILEDGILQQDIPDYIFNLPNIHTLSLANNNLSTTNLNLNNIFKSRNINQLDITGQATYTQRLIGDVKAGDIIDTLPNLSVAVGAFGYSSPDDLIELVFDTLKPSMERVYFVKAKQAMADDKHKTNIIKFRSQIFGDYVLVYNESSGVERSFDDFNQYFKPRQVNRLTLNLPNELFVQNIPDDGLLLKNENVIKVEPDNLSIGDSVFPVWNVEDKQDLLIISPEQEVNLRLLFKDNAKGKIRIKAVFPHDSSYTESEWEEILVGQKAIDSVKVLNTFAVRKDTAMIPLILTLKDTVQILKDSRHDFSIILHNDSSTNLQLQKLLKPIYGLSQDVYRIRDTLRMKDEVDYDFELMDQELVTEDENVVEVFPWIDDQNSSSALITYRIKANNQGLAKLQFRPRVVEGQTIENFASILFKVVEEEKVYFAPNPVPPGFIKKAYFFFQSSEPRSLIIFDSYGRLVKRLDIDSYELYGSDDLHRAPVDFSNFKPGMYYVKIERSTIDSGYMKTIVIQ